MHPILLAAALAASAVPADCPHEPGCSAMTVLHEVELDNSHEHASLFVHIVRRFFTQEGVERHAAIQLADDAMTWDLTDVQGLVILPDGARQTFRPERSITPPGLVPGATLEFSYRQILRASGALSRWEWLLQEPIPVLEARLTLRQGALPLAWQQKGQERVPIEQSEPGEGVVAFRAARVPSIPSEPFSAPPDVLAARLHFYSAFEADWLGQIAGRLAGRAGEFMAGCEKARAKAMELTRDVADPLQKAAALYRFVQRTIAGDDASLTKPRPGSERASRSVDDVLEKRSGSEWERTVLFLAMAREAGLEQGLLAISSRLSGTLNQGEPDDRQFDTFAAAVKANDQWTFYDPGQPHCPLAMVVPYKESTVPNAILVTPVPGEGFSRTMRESGYVGTVHDTAPYVIATIPPSSADRNTASLQISMKVGTRGVVEIEVIQTATGLAELDLRRKYADLDDSARRAMLKQELLASNIGAHLHETRFENLSSWDRPARITYSASFPGVVSRKEDRLEIAASIFDAARPLRFEAATRRTAVHLAHKEKTSTRIAIEVPAGYVARELPPRQVIEEGHLRLATFYGRDLGRIVLTRTLIVDQIVWEKDSYPLLRSFFQRVRQADQQPLVLWAETAP